MKTAAIYTRVSSDHQKENKTIGSQVDELLRFAEEQGYVVPGRICF
jgi:site-specific DNA recombinase